MNLIEEKHHNVLVIRIDGRMDAITVAEFSQCFDTRIAAGETGYILDMSSLSYISSAGLGGVLTAFKKAEAHKGMLLLCGLNGQVRDAFQLSGFLTCFKTYDSIDDALSKIRNCLRVEDVLKRTSVI